MTKKYAIKHIITIFCLVNLLNFGNNIWAKEIYSKIDVRSMILSQIPNYITWKKSNFVDEKAYFTIILLGDTPFKSNFNDLFKGKTIAGRNIEIKRYNTIKDINELSQAHIVFISKTFSKEETKNAIVFFNTKKSITISCQDDFILNGGIIELITINKNIRFNINNINAKKNKIKINPKLLGFANKVINEN